MANMNKEATVAIHQFIANAKAKLAELDALDNEFADFDAVTPEGEGIETFNLLSEKREELETEIRSMRERVQLISEWEKFKGSGWSDDVQIELNSLDQQFATIADGAEAAGADLGLGAPMMPEPPMSPDVPLAPEAPITPATPDVPADPIAEPEVSDPAMDAIPFAPVASSKRKAASEEYYRQTLQHILDLAKENIPSGGEISGYSQIAEWASNALNKSTPPVGEYGKFSSVVRPSHW
jgi:hypothetical protein